MNTELTIQEAAAMLGMQPRALQKQLQRGTIAGRNAYGRVWLIPQTEIDRLRDNRPRAGRPRRGASAASAG